MRRPPGPRAGRGPHAASVTAPRRRTGRAGPCGRYRPRPPHPPGSRRPGRRGRPAPGPVTSAAESTEPGPVPRAASSACRAWMPDVVRSGTSLRNQMSTKPTKITQAATRNTRSIDCANALQERLGEPRVHPLQDRGVLDDLGGTGRRVHRGGVDRVRRDGRVGERGLERRRRGRGPEGGADVPADGREQDRQEDRDPDRAAHLAEEGRRRRGDAHVGGRHRVLHREDQGLHAVPESRGRTRP